MLRKMFLKFLRQKQGVQHRMVLVVKFFIFLNLNVFALLFLYLFDLVQDVEAIHDLFKCQ